MTEGCYAFLLGASGALVVFNWLGIFTLPAAVTVISLCLFAACLVWLLGKIVG